jgi:hypothetical protein
MVVNRLRHGETVAGSLTGMSRSRMRWSFGTRANQPSRGPALGAAVGRCGPASGAVLLGSSWWRASRFLRTGACSGWRVPDEEREQLLGESLFSLEIGQMPRSLGDEQLGVAEVIEDLSRHRLIGPGVL